MNQDLRPPDRLRAGSLGVLHIVFFVVAAAAPLTAVVGGSPGAFAYGNGIGVPGAYLLAGALYLVFAAGVTAMSRHVADAGAFYAYIGLGLGPTAGVAGAFLAILAYQSVQAAVYALFGLFASEALAGAGLGLPWWGCAIAAAAVVHLCGRRNVRFSGRVLGVCLICEIAVLAALAIAIVAARGPEGLTAAPFRPENVFAHGLGAAMVFVVASFIGFEASAIFGEEARRPRRDVARATYAAVGLITLLYAGSSWAIEQFHGIGSVVEAARTDPTGLYIGPARALLGPFAARAMELLLILSLFACALSFHSAISRYLFALGRAGIASRRLARIDPVHGSPADAGLAQSAAAVAIIAAFALARQDPFAIVFSWMSALGTIAMLALQILVALAVIAFFHRRAAMIGGDTGPFSRLVAPAVAAVGLAVCLGLVIGNLELLAGSKSAEVQAFPALVALVGAAGAVLGRLRRTAGASAPIAAARVDTDPFAQ